MHTHPPPHTHTLDPVLLSLIKDRNDFLGMSSQLPRKSMSILVFKKEALAGFIHDTLVFAHVYYDSILLPIGK